MATERERNAMNGYAVLIINILIYPFSIIGFIFAVNFGPLLLLLMMITLMMVNIFISAGFFVVNPNDSRVLVLFGTYKGTVKKNGFYWANPFLSKKKITLRARNLNGERMKVNDKQGNPIEIAAVVVWCVDETAKASFDVDDYEEYVVVQSEAAIRHLAGSYSYDSFNAEEEEISLRDGAEQVNEALERELTERFQRAGIDVVEARISHLAYAPEIAEAMLRRQQAAAVVAARTKIVEGAVGMVRLALDSLAEEGVVDFDEDKKATMVSNLLVVLCGESQVTPVVNTGSLYQ